MISHRVDNIFDGIFADYLKVRVMNLRKLIGFE